MNTKMQTVIIHTLILSFMIACCSNPSWAQDNSNDPELVTIAGEKIRKSEFLNIYDKNKKTESAYNESSREDYLSLFINYKLKVAEAKDLGLDTTVNFKRELEGYRKQLSQPYLVDKNINEDLITEAYERKMHDIRASHLLIKIAPDSDPQDTLNAYNKIGKIRMRLLKDEDFEKVARQVSEDPSVKDNGGDLGYFTVFQMVYPFESAAYKTPVGKISSPVRTKFGYHLIMVTDKKEALGEVQVAHIMMITRQGASQQDIDNAKKKIDEAYSKMQSGQSFDDLVKQYSEDKKTAVNGGILPPFKTGMMVGNFEKTVSDLKKDGEISSPVRTEYGWHIVKRVSRKPIPAYKELRDEISKQITRDSRAEVSKSVFIARLKKEYNFTQNIPARNDFYKVIDDSYFEKKWTSQKAAALNGRLFSLSDQNYTQQHFAGYIEKNQANGVKVPIKKLVNKLYEQFTDEACMAFENSRLEQKYPEFKSLIDEYRDGILLFELTDRKVWSKAIQDSVGLSKFYDQNKTNYMWEERLKASVYTIMDESILAKAKKLAAKRVNKGYSKEEFIKMLGATEEAIKIQDALFLKNDNPFVDKTNWKPGLSDNFKTGEQTVFVFVEEKLQPVPKSLIESRGLVAADYQIYLEKEWIELLRKKYTVDINRDVLTTIK